jgi:hypothetical protein
MLLLDDTQIIYLRATGGEVGASSALAPKIGPLGLVGDFPFGDLGEPAGRRDGACAPRDQGEVLAAWGGVWRPACGVRGRIAVGATERRLAG